MKRFALHYKLGEEVHWLAIQCAQKPTQDELKDALKNKNLPHVDIKELSPGEYDNFILSNDYLCLNSLK